MQIVQDTDALVAKLVAEAGGPGSIFALSAADRSAARDRFEQAMNSFAEDASAGGGDGFVFGLNALEPDQRIDKDDLGMIESCVFTWSRPRGAGPIFEWDQVGYLHIDEASAYVVLTDARVLGFHADIDWWNRLS